MNHALPTLLAAVACRTRRASADRAVRGPARHTPGRIHGQARSTADQVHHTVGPVRPAQGPTTLPDRGPVVPAYRQVLRGVPPEAGVPHPARRANPATRTRLLPTSGTIATGRPRGAEHVR
ncbi:hypothetical protein FHS29_001235 [Saccharothrix tamanrassetensis]|uniref:Uncharacterized protein n=1 Tax=Saccharothrix tamanrassetensis TaxID=1051531 RepID=A0A841CF72_9PSEU|nr:hypothetical protein [Saccharothrix tamanrassetensis]MBB5954665.1 hypothetical protein [Saccharothrix tamanrassetensis]